MRRMLVYSITLLVPVWVNSEPLRDHGREAWIRHTIDDSSQGADGVRLADADGDGLLDIATGWEEGGVIRVYLNPGPERSKSAWPNVTVGRVGSPEDAVLVDVDGDGAMDVVSCSEGETRRVSIHWAPKEANRRLDSSAWTTESIPAVENAAQWMFCLPMQIDGKNGVDLVLGAKNENAHIGWLESPDEPRRLEDWRWHPLIEAGWIMTLAAWDFNGDGAMDILASDRKGDSRGCFWLEHPGAERAAEAWPRHAISGSDQEFMFIDLADLNGDDLPDLPAAVRSRELSLYMAQPPFPSTWRRRTIPFPPNTGTGKSVRIGDLNLDGKPDLVLSCENATEDRRGVFWMEKHGGEWDSHPISGPGGVKFDLIELIDLDADGDLDVLTCEERSNLGVVWYENPSL
ncbi:MAG: VCBS repeat-containing protein [Candidatus Omnitrophica bacterium]|nr:VCBS repeat-containing protein [Candidatus Omnitrophota bacterium]